MNHRSRARIGLLTVLLLGAGCEDRDPETGPTSPSPAPAPAVDTIEFRVTGNIPSARIRVSDPINGLTQVVSGLPYFGATQSTRATVFLSIEATALEPAVVGSGLLVVSIIVNGEVFREASSVGFLPYATTSGTYRR